jgi:hypothetical protein
MGTPATARLSFTPTDSPASGPCSAPLTRQRRMNAWNGSSASLGGPPGSRSVYTSGGAGAHSSSMRSTPTRVWSRIAAYCSASLGVSERCSAAPSAATWSAVGRRTKPRILPRGMAMTVSFLGGSGGQLLDDEPPTDSWVRSANQDCGSTKPCTVDASTLGLRSLTTTSHGESLPRIAAIWA